MSEEILKLQPHRTLSLQGFDAFGAAAALWGASDSGFSVSGVFRDQADFAIVVLFLKDDPFGHPRFSYLPDGNISFDLLSHGTVRNLTFDPSTGNITSSASQRPRIAESPLVSPDGRWSVFVTSGNRPRQLWIRNLGTGHAGQLTQGFCENSNPAWTPDSQSLVFSSDCGRAFGLPTLYVARVSQFPQ